MKARVNGIELYFELSDAGDRVVTLLHGSADNCHAWWNQVPVLEAAGFRVLTIDQRGFGETEIVPMGDDCPDGSIACGYGSHQIAADVAALLDHLGIAETDVVGHSMGGYVGRWLQSARPELVRSLTLLHAGGYRPRHQQWLARSLRLAQHVEREGMAAATGARMLRLFAPGFAERDPAMVERYATMRLRSNPEGYRRSLLEVGRRSHYPDPSSLTCPVLLVTGDHDPLLDVADVEQLAAALPKARLEVFENCGHVSKIEHPDRLNQVLLEFLSQEAPAIRPAPPQRASA